MTVEDFLREATIMKKLRHPNIITLYAVCTQEEPIFIVTEFMSKGSLIDVLMKTGPTMELIELIEICGQVKNIILFTFTSYISLFLQAMMQDLFSVHWNTIH